jgi:hypothetical protein
MIVPDERPTYRLTLRGEPTRYGLALSRFDLILGTAGIGMIAARSAGA